MFCAAQQNYELAGNLGVKQNHRIADRLLRCAFSTIVVFFYSKNLRLSNGSFFLAF
jgi:hypothetical protein